MAHCLFWVRLQRLVLLCFSLFGLSVLLSVSLVANCFSRQESQEKEGEKMDKSGRFAIFSPSYLGGENGNRNSCKSRSYKGIISRIFSFFRFYCRISLWLFCSVSSYALAEFSDTDSTRLFNLLTNVEDIEEKLETLKQSQSASLNSQGRGVATIAGEIETNTFQMYNKLIEVSNSLGYAGGYDNLKFDLQTLRNYQAAHGTLLEGIMRGIGSTSGTAWSGETLASKLDKILTAIESLENTGTGSGGEIPSDIATETTLSAFKDQYEQLANQFLNSWGFSQEMTLSNYLSNTFNPTQFTIYAPQIQQRGGAQYQEPFPGSTDKWGNLISQSYTFQSQGSFLGDLLLGLSNLEVKSREADLYWRKKQAWNDWQAHTNLISTLRDIYQQPKKYIDKSSDIGSVNDETGEMSITFNDAEGGSPPTPEVIDTKIVFTNDFSQLETKAVEAEDALKDINYSKMKEIYKVPQGVETNNYQDYAQSESIPDYVLQYGTEKKSSFVFTATHRQMYNSLLSPSLLNKLRGVFAKLWFFLSVYFNFVLFKIFGKVND